jgi:hypothetical protein
MFLKIACLYSEHGVTLRRLTGAARKQGHLIVEVKDVVSDRSRCQQNELLTPTPTPTEHSACFASGDDASTLSGVDLLTHYTLIALPSVAIFHPHTHPPHVPTIQPPLASLKPLSQFLSYALLSIVVEVFRWWRSKRFGVRVLVVRLAFVLHS